MKKTLLICDVCAQGVADSGESGPSLAAEHLVVRGVEVKLSRDLCARHLEAVLGVLGVGKNGHAAPRPGVHRTTPPWKITRPVTVKAMVRRWGLTNAGARYRLDAALKAGTIVRTRQPGRGGGYVYSPAPANGTRQLGRVHAKKSPPRKGGKHGK